MRKVLLSTSALLLSIATLAGAQSAKPAHAMKQATAASAAGDEAIVANALSAAPAPVARGATVVALDGRVLRKGATKWVCMPDMPDLPFNSPMCLDEPWNELIDAWMHHRAPKVTRIGVGYMLQGDFPVSNVDPYAKAPTSTNEWVAEGTPHVMMVFPDARQLEGFSTDSKSGDPYVMWRGTPYAHVMIPTLPPPKQSR
jgi:hypothetical protein